MMRGIFRSIPGLVVPGLAVLGLTVLAVSPGAAAAQQVYVTGSRPAWLGVGYDVRWVQAEERCEPQVVVEQVVQGSPAERAGLRSGDVIVAMGGQPIPAGRLGVLATHLEPGDSVRLRVLRDGRGRELMAVAGSRPERPPSIIVRSGADGLRVAPGPVAKLEGETLVLRNVDSTPSGARGYWLATPGGGAEYRRLSAWPRDEMDERVSRLMRCVQEVDWSPAAAPSVDLHAFQRRADSLRVAMARRALERDPGQPGVVPAAPEAPRPDVADGLPLAPARIQVVTEPDEPGSYTFVFENQLAAGMRGVAGAEITELEPELAEYFRNARDGLLVLRVAAGTLADRAGLRPGDVIVRGDDHSLTSVAELRLLLAESGAQPLSLRVVRRGETRTLTLDRR